jgi:SAM-dependent MidA family methyltransferase
MADMQYEQKPGLPPPDAASAQHSARVSAYIRTQIDNAGGYIGFSRFMHEALYAPGLGYYSAGATKFGAAGDFTTAPEVSSLFGRVLARQCAEVMADTGHRELLEVGAGSGKLALDMLQALAKLDALPDTYRIVDVSPDLVERQKILLRDQVPQLAGRVRWISQLPREFNGVIVANELLDALPVERFIRRSGDVMQLGVVCEGREFQWCERAASEQLQAAVAEIQSDIGRDLDEGYTSEVSLAAPAWVSDIAQSLQHGVVFLFDYGVSRREYYAPDRTDGWLRCHFRHRAHNQPLMLPGIQDLTAWVDFTAIAGAAAGNGLSVLGYQTQSQFLLGGGLDIEVRAIQDLPEIARIKLASEIKTLTLPGEMGENFKCIALGKGVTRAPSVFHYADRTGTL